MLHTFSGEKAKVTMAFEPKFVRTARLIPFPRVRSGNISDTISQLIGPKDICNRILYLRTKKTKSEILKKDKQGGPVIIRFCLEYEVFLDVSH